MDYPLNARQNAATGTVYVTFVIDKSGKVLSPEVLKSVDGYPEFSTEAVRLVSEMPTWKPGTIDDEPVNVRYNLPVRFAF
ncbi:MAG: energy transducer TonB, partial [Bacteroidia bacterium]|nr:energy transducer TonB [Bacteroidia bacterium]